MNFLVNPIIDIVKSTLKSILPPEKMKDSERIAIENRMEEKLLEYDWKGLEVERQDRASARRLANKELSMGNAYTNILAALHRPMWSFVTLAVFAWSMISQSFGFPEIALTEVHKDIMMTVIIFYFGGRSVEKVVKFKK